MNISATVNYHIKSNTSQAFHFDVDGIDGNLISPELVTTEVKVKDLRGQTDAVNFNDNGITFKTFPSNISAFDDSDAWHKQYNQEISQLLKSEIGASEVIVFDHTLRIDDPDALRRPARNVHNDYSSDGAEQRLVDLLGSEKANEYLQGSFAFVNVWRPIENIITSSPLGFIHPLSMQQDDWMDIELVYPTRHGQILGVAANAKHEWFYQSNMHPDEVVIFNIYDNQGRAHLAHSALDLINQAPTSVPRKSLETRTLVRYPN
ncbi:CmcJ/NvfI family oxidoreductase [Glaciecola sp. 2405UD65-10]|uniref:CmcJ/NvfI family oxidoreductase n=1 Tax=Glaciecola sp. 2405UD65-10 TaxID=3397244 RepID=UPI003B5A89B8